MRIVDEVLVGFVEIALLVGFVEIALLVGFVEIALLVGFVEIALMSLQLQIKSTHSTHRAADNDNEKIATIGSLSNHDDDESENVI